MFGFASPIQSRLGPLTAHLMAPQQAAPQPMDLSKLGAPVGPGDVRSALAKFGFGQPPAATPTAGAPAAPMAPPPAPPPPVAPPPAAAADAAAGAGAATDAAAAGAGGIDIGAFLAALFGA